MFPLRDENPTVRTPIVTMALILVNVAVWFYVEGAGVDPRRLQEAVCQFGMIPAELTGQTGAYEGVRLGRGYECAFGGLTWSTVGTSMFLHGSWLHLIGNMWFLWLFGNNVEDGMGRFRFLVFYLLTGVAADGAHLASALGSPIPTVGASGAISGVMGAYLVLFPRVRVDTLFIFFFFIRILPIPAWFVLGEWFLIQLLQGTAVSSAGAGVAFWAHIGGFIAGLVVVKPFASARLLEAKARLDRRNARRDRRRRIW